MSKLKTSEDAIQNKNKKEEVKVRFLADWERLWKYLEKDEADEMSVYAPLLRLIHHFILKPYIVSRSFMDFFFHEKTVLFLTFVFVYNIVIVTLGISDFLY